MASIDIPPAVTDALATAGSAVSTAASTAGSVVGAATDQVGDLIMTIPVPEPVVTLYGTYFGEAPLMEVFKEWGPILYCSVLPLLCIFFGICGLCEGSKKAMGTRVKRRVMLAVRGGIRMAGSPANLKKLKGGGGYKGLSAAESGKSPLKNSAMNKKEEAAIKAKAAANPRRY